MPPRTSFALLTLLIIGAIAASVAHAAPLSYTANTILQLTSPATTLTIQAGSMADSVIVNAGNVAVTMSSSTGGTFILASPQALSSSTSGSGGTDVQTCSGGIETDTITQSSNSETYTLTPTGSACGTPSGGGGNGGVTAASGGGGSAYTISINGGASTIATTSATLSLYGTSAYTMRLSNDPAFASSTWIPYLTSVPWTLNANPGEETVYAQYRTVGGTIVGRAQAQIDFAPVGSAPQSLATTAASPGTGSANASSTSSLQSQLAALEAELAALQAKAGKALAPAPPSSNPFLFEKALQYRQSGPDVKRLQEFLAEDAAIYPEGKITGYFGPATLKAVQRFQAKYGIAKAGDEAYGYVGPATRAKLNALMSNGIAP